MEELKELINQYVEVISELSIQEQRVKLLEMKFDLLNQEKYNDVSIIDERLKELG